LTQLRWYWSVVKYCIYWSKWTKIFIWIYTAFCVTSLIARFLDDLDGVVVRRFTGLDLFLEVIKELELGCSN